MRTEEQKKARHENDAERGAKYKEYYYANPEELRSCRKCGESKPLRDFMSLYSFRNKCKQCHGKAVGKWRENNPVVASIIKSRSYETSAKWIQETKPTKCADCKREYPSYVMDYHHIGAKSAAISNLYEKSRHRIQAEIDKCISICANCHRNRTQDEMGKIPVNANRIRKESHRDTIIVPGALTKMCVFGQHEKHVDDFTTLKSGKKHSYCKNCMREVNRKSTPGRKRATSEYLKEYKDSHSCMDCKVQYRYWVMDFDHIGEKKLNVSRMRGRSMESLLSEIGQCDLVCANCHRIRTHELRSILPSPRAIRTGNIQKIDFDVKQIRVRICTDERIAQKILRDNHYASVGRPARRYYVAYLQDKVIAVAKLTPVIRKEVATKMGLNHEEVVELDRFCIVPEYQIQNLASKFLSELVKCVKADMKDISTLVSFADTAQGHNGGIYRASNWKWIGMAAPSHMYMDDRGKSINKKTLYNAAVRTGMTEKQYAETNGLKKIHIPAKHKFVMRVR